MPHVEMVTHYLETPPNNHVHSIPSETKTCENMILSNEE